MVLAFAQVKVPPFLTSIYPGALPVSLLPPQDPSTTLSHISDTFSLPHSLLLPQLMSVLETCPVRAILASD